MARRGTTGQSANMDSMKHGVIDGISGSWASGLGFLIIDGQPVPCDNAATVRALDACFGDVVSPGHLVNQETIVGMKIWYSVSPWGVLETFSPVDDNRRPADEKEGQDVLE